MPTAIVWSSKFAPDPEHPGYVKHVGQYAADFLSWAKIFGQPTWSYTKENGVMTRSIWLRDPKIDRHGATHNEAASFEVKDKGLSLQIFWPLSVLEKTYYSMQGRSSVGLIDPRTGEARLKSAI